MSEIEELIKKQRSFYRRGRTKPLEFRLKALGRLETAVRMHEESIEMALQKDLGKSGFESYMTEVGMVYSELRYIRRHLRLWNMDREVLSPLAQFPSRTLWGCSDHGSLELSVYAEHGTADWCNCRRQLLHREAICLCTSYLIHIKPYTKGSLSRAIRYCNRGRAERKYGIAGTKV